MRATRDLKRGLLHPALTWQSRFALLQRLFAEQGDWDYAGDHEGHEAQGRSDVLTMGQSYGDYVKLLDQVPSTNIELNDVVSLLPLTIRAACCCFNLSA